MHDIQQLLRPLSLYIHIPWCVQLCPYCDFNSHQMKGKIPESEYIAHLLNDLKEDLSLISYQGQVRPISSIFIGGGTPSLLSIEGMHKLLQGVKALVPLTADAEITMEANPGTVEAQKFKGFKEAGVNRISIGVQSFNDEHLNRLGRVHNAGQAIKAIDFAHELDLVSFNTDIMHGLPEQRLEQALSDLQKSIDANTPHISWYQLTIEPNTLFASKPPVLPDDDTLWEIHLAGQELLSSNGYQQYEVSGFGREGHRCQHNLNYWRFGDYLGIGCGAHGKITDGNTGKVLRTEKVKHPKGYMDLAKAYTFKQHFIESQDLPFEFFMNRFRLMEPCPVDDYEKLCGEAIPANVRDTLKKAEQRGLLNMDAQLITLTKKGHRFLNSLLTEFI